MVDPSILQMYARERPERPAPTPQQRERAQQRYRNSAHFQARVELQKDRIVAQQRDREIQRQQNRAAFDKERADRMAARAAADAPNTPEEQAFKGRGFKDLNKAGKDAFNKMAFETMTAINAARPGLWENSEPGRASAAAFQTLAAYSKGEATNGDLDKALKDMSYANRPSKIADPRTGEISPQKEKTAAAWSDAIHKVHQTLDLVRTLDSQKGPAIDSQQPQPAKASSR
jgi:hypothetical protein